MIYEYLIHPKANMVEFKRVCERIEKEIPQGKKGRQSEDVDGTVVQSYMLGNKGIHVMNDVEDMNEVYVRSEIPLDYLFGKPVWISK